jgi:hypothetical protein
MLKKKKKITTGPKLTQMDKNCKINYQNRPVTQNGPTLLKMAKTSILGPK